MAHTPRSLLRALIGLTAAVILLAACGSTPAPGAAAVVGGTDITTDEVARTAAVFTAVSAIQQQPCGQLDGATDTQQAACNRQALSTLILQRLAEGYAAGAGITVPDAKVDETYTSFEDSVGKDALAAQLQANGAVVDDVKALVRGSLLEQAVAEAVTAERLTDDVVRQRYRDAIGTYTTLHVDHILVQTEAAAQAIHEEMTAPGTTLADFQARAREVSIDPNAKQDGGELTQPASQLVPEFSQAALALAPGEISEPVQTQYGWHVIWKIGQDVTPLSEVKQQLLQDAQQEEFGAWLRDQSSSIDVDPSFGRFDEQQLIVVRITSTDASATAVPSGPVNGATPSP